MRAGYRHASLPNPLAAADTSGVPPFSLRSDGLLSIVCPVTDDTDLCGVAIFNTSVEQARQIMDDDPGVRAGVFTYEVHPIRSFPGDSLPG
jgi:hypothetical protein